MRATPSARAVLAACWLLAGAGIAFAQSGSVGGVIGKQDKSVSGGDDAQPRSARPAARRADRPAPARRARERAEGGGASFDGAWVVRSVGETCSGGASQAVVVSSGRIIGQGVTGRVSPSGAVSTAGSFNGVEVTSSGRLSGRGGTGSFRQSDGCVGRWYATKQ